jgi:hypothetical protein
MHLRLRCKGPVSVPHTAKRPKLPPRLPKGRGFFLMRPPAALLFRPTGAKARGRRGLGALAAMREPFVLVFVRLLILVFAAAWYR